ncbi:MAG: gliding motility-associated ABC transporter permease subunit GldF [Flavobacteriales bacterium]|nr:gliding motility-associated ABC transporter permease subunit GldF [Bacteroidota bacterium]MCB9241282.1 gliding motility-associated ABC transporter permease subunit GldF [Flavobacteriales bacterium]
MFSILSKEIRGFLSSLIAYVVISVFLLAIGLFMWIYPSTNALDYGQASLDTLFMMAPWVFIFLISAITMRSFAEEKKTGTIEILSTRPVTDWQIIMGKFFAGLILVLFALIPTLLYFYTIYELGSPRGIIDTGATWGSYIGLALLGSCYVAIGLFASALTDNQIVAFLLSTFLCFFLFSALGQLAALFDGVGLEYSVEWLSINFHYESIRRGVVDTRDVLFFVSFTALFLGLTHLVFGRRKWQ